MGGSVKKQQAVAGSGWEAAAVVVAAWQGLGGYGAGRATSCSSWTRLSTCPLFGVGRRCSSWEAVQLLDKVADMPVAVPQLQFVKVVDDPVVQVVAGVCPVLGQGG